MLLNIIDYINDTGYEVNVRKDSTDVFIITLRDPGTDLKNETALSNDALRRITDKRYFQTRILGVMADQLKIAVNEEKRKREELQKAAEMRRSLWDFWKGPVFIDGSRSKQSGD